VYDWPDHREGPRDEAREETGARGTAQGKATPSRPSATTVHHRALLAHFPTVTSQSSLSCRASHQNFYNNKMKNINPKKVEHSDREVRPMERGPTTGKGLGRGTFPTGVIKEETSPRTTGPKSRPGLTSGYKRFPLPPFVHLPHSRW
jgi:hypothetical protein